MNILRPRIISSIVFILLIICMGIATSPDIAWSDKVGDKVTFKTWNFNTKKYEDTKATCREVGNHSYIRVKQFNYL